MHYSTILALGAASVITAAPLTPRAVNNIAPGTTWDIIINNNKYYSVSKLKATPGSVIDIDLFDTSKADIAELRKTKTVICYFSAGTREDWRTKDKDLFKKEDYGKAMEEWEGENWVDVKSANVRKIMAARIKFAKDQGCNAVDPDNIDGYVSLVLRLIITELSVSIQVPSII